MIMIMIITIMIIPEAIIFENLLCAMNSTRHVYNLSFHVSDSSHISQMEIHLRSIGLKSDEYGSESHLGLFTTYVMSGQLLNLSVKWGWQFLSHRKFMKLKLNAMVYMKKKPRYGVK